MDENRSFATRGALRWATWIGLWLLATAIAVLFAVQHRVYSLALGEPVPLWRLLPGELARWCLWAALTPLVVRVAEYYRADEPRHPLGTAAVHATCATAFAATHAWLSATVTWWLGVHRLAPRLGAPISAQMATLFTADLLIYAAIVITYYAVDAHRRLRARELNALRLEAGLAHAQLLALAGELQPHFLLNTLNAIASLMATDTEAAEDMMAQLGELLRTRLRLAGRAAVPLREELAFIERYLDLMRMRYGERLRVTMRTDPSALDVPVPSLLLQPIVENALRHGIAAHRRCGVLQIAVERHDALMHVSVRDDGPGLAPEWREGVGLANTRARLERMYGEAHRLEMRPADGGGLEVRLVLPYRPRLAAASSIMYDDPSWYAAARAARG